MFPALVICPRWRCSPLEYSEGTIPSHEHSSRGWLKRAKSPISAISPSAVRVEIPRKHKHRDLSLPALALRDPLQLGVEHSELPVQPVEMDQHLLQRPVRELVAEALAGDPRAMHLRPLRLALTVDTTVAQQLLGDTVTRRRPGAAQIVAAAHQVPEAFGLRRRWLHEGQLAGAAQAHELLRVAAVGLDAIPGADRDQRRRDNVARHPETGQQPVQVEPAGPGLVTDRQTLGAAEPVDEPADRPLGRLDPVQLRLTATRRQRRSDDRQLVLIDRHPQADITSVDRRCNVRHGLVLETSRMRRPKRPSTPARLTRDTYDVRGPASCVHTG